MATTKECPSGECDPAVLPHSPDELEACLDLARRMSTAEMCPDCYGNVRWDEDRQEYVHEVSHPECWLSKGAT